MRGEGGGDFDGDGSGDGNSNGVNNGVGGYDEADVEDLPGGSLRTQSIAIADVNNDGFDDIIFGNSNQAGPQVNQLLLNNGAGTFTNETLPGGALDTASIAVIPTAPRVSMFYS